MSLGCAAIFRGMMRVSIKSLENFNCLVPIKLIEAARSLRRGIPQKNAKIAMIQIGNRLGGSLRNGSEDDDEFEFEDD